VHGKSAQFTVVITRTSFPASVHLTASGLPAGVGATFKPKDTRNGSTLTTSTAKSVKPGTYPLTVTATSGSLSRTATGQLTVTSK
jgi:uncharacterized membrane protein